MSEAPKDEFLLTAKLVERSDPRYAWGFYRPICEREVRKAVKNGKLFDPKDELLGHIKSHSDHVRRIAWFVVNGWDEPIEVDVGVPALGCHVGHIIIDGNHRVAAALFRRDPAIWANVSGDVAEIRKFKP